ncbi:MAG TPA: hypothetical protein VMW19_13405 [Myxococcota bacterium]|nr:hypothetical protein [Myxococcota bacterium]
MSSDSGSGLPPVPPPPPDEPDEPAEIEAPGEREGVELELDESVIEEPDETEKEEAPLPAPKRSKTVTRKPAHAPAPVVARRAPRPAPPTLSLDPGQVRVLLAEQPGMVEKGLGVHSDASGRQVGVDFETPVGDIDLLARDPRGGFVIILVPEHDDPDLVPGLLRRMGWVRKHLCKSGEAVRAVAVMNDVPESALYAAAGLADGVIRFVGYRFALEFYEHHEASAS